MKNIVFLFLFLVPAFLFAQYPTGTNKSRLGYQTTGDGLIWRGVAADTAIKPRTTANAYFQLDTVNRVLRRYIATQGSWQVVGATPDLSAYLLKSDTAAMLVKYIERGDTATMLVRYIERGDTAAMLANYPTFGDIATSLGNYLPIIGGTLTGTGGAGFIGFPAQSGTPSTPASGFKMYANGAHNLAILDRNGWITTFDISATSNRFFTLPSTGGTFALGTGTADRSVRWSATNTLATGNFTDNGTKVQALLPFQFQTYTTAGLPTGVTGYHVYNTTTNGPGWYNGTRWGYGLESTFNRGTSTRVPYFDANGQIIDNANMVADVTNNRYYFAGSGNTGTSTLNSSTGLRFELRTTDNSTFTGGYLALGSQFGIGAAIKYRHNNGSGNTNGGIDFFTRVNPSDATLTRQMQLDVNGLLTIEGSAILKGDVTMGRVRINNVTASGATYGNITEGVLSNGNYQNSQAAAKIDFLNGNYDFQTAPIGVVNNPVTLTSRMYLTNAGLLRLGGTGTTNYQLDVQGTNAIGFPRGPVAQRPTIASSTTPIRFDTDSTALEYGESVGVWRLLATRAYARSLVGAISITNIGNSDLSLTGNRILHGAGYSLAFNANTTVRDSFIAGNLPEFDSEYITISDNSTGLQGKKKFLMLSDSAYNGINSGFFFDKGIIGKQLSGNNYSCLDYADTTGFFDHSIRNQSGDYNGVFGNGGAGYKDRNTRIKKGSQIISLDMGLDGLLLNTDNLFSIFSADSFGIIWFSQYGTGTKEAADLSKTQSNYIAGFATDGTVLDLNVDTLLKKEKYFTITSTSSPQTLSNNFSDNLINQGGTQATFTLKFPASPVDGQVLKITYNNAITTLTLDGNGNTIVGSAVVTGVAGSQRAFKFYSGIGWIKLY